LAFHLITGKHTVADSSRWRRIIGACLIVVGVSAAYVTGAAGGPFWLVFAALLVAWVGIALNLKIS
jgi:hypothetical protein